MDTKWTVESLKNFESEIGDIFNSGKIKAPVHLSDGNEEGLINVFKNVSGTDWVLCSWRSHYQSLLKGVPAELVKSEIISGRSISLCFPQHRVFSSAIVGGHVSISVGIAMAEKNNNSKKSKLKTI
jgi:pyruvate dehydrogenase E1 component alpha subunit